MRASFPLVAGALASTVWCSVAGALPIAASMNLTASITTDLESDTQTSSDAWPPVLNPLSIDASASASASCSDQTFGVGGTGSATWGAGGNSGSVLFSYGWNLCADTVATLNSNSAPDWSYTFEADADGVFSMTFNVTAGGGDPFGLQGWNIGWSGPGGGLILADVSDPTASGTFTRSVAATQTYVVTLKNNANIDTGAEFSAFMDGVFEFTITSGPPPQVPEPGSLALLGIALAGIAFARRRTARPR